MHVPYIDEQERINHDVGNVPERGPSSLGEATAVRDCLSNGINPNHTMNHFFPREKDSTTFSGNNCCGFSSNLSMQIKPVSPSWFPDF